MLFEDTDVERRRAIVDQRVGLISTGDFLRELEAAGLIQSTDHILDQAAAQGRNVERQRAANEMARRANDCAANWRGVVAVHERRRSICLVSRRGRGGSSSGIQHGNFHALADAAERGFDSTDGTALQPNAQATSVFNICHRQQTAVR